MQRTKQFLNDARIDAIPVSESLHHKQVAAYRTKVFLGLEEVVVQKFCSGIVFGTHSVSGSEELPQEAAQSHKTASVNNSLFTVRCPLYSISPILLNLFMK